MEISEKWRSRKFIVLIIGLIVYIISELTGIDPLQIEPFINVIIAYMLGQAGIDLVNTYTLNKREGA
jgi:hypothetical protein